MEKNITFKESDWRLQALYQLGHVKGRMPLKDSDIVLSNSDEVPSGMHSVARFTDPYKEEPTNIAWENSLKSNTEKVYMYIRGEQEKKGKYISGLYVSSYEKPKSSNSHTYTDDEYDQLAKMADDNAIIGLCSKAKGEIYNYNIAIDQKKAWYNNPEAENKDATYIGVSRTDREDYAITGIIMYKTKNLSPIRIKLDGIEYHRTGDKFGDYYMYYTKSPGANPGVPIEDISFDNIPIVEGSSTAVGVTKGDKDEVKYMNDFSGYKGFLHMNYSKDDSVISDIAIEKGDKDKAYMNLMRRGYNYVIKESLNANAGGSKVWIGYKMCSSDVIDIMGDDSYFDDEDEDDYMTDDDEYDQEDEDCFGFDIDFDVAFPDEDVVRDVLAVTGEEYKETINHGGREYKAVSDISLNDGTNGKTIYLYCSKDNNSDAAYLPALKDITMCSGDAVPYTEGTDSNNSEEESEYNSRFGVWEIVLTDKDREANMNEGVIATDSSGRHIKDSRLYLFVQRFDGKVKRGAEITRGYVQDTIEKADLYITN